MTIIEKALARLENPFLVAMSHGDGTSRGLTRELAALIRETHAALDGMDQAGGNGQGMPECPWCQAQPDYDDMVRHAHDCRLFTTRAALIALCEAIVREKP